MGEKENILIKSENDLKAQIKNLEGNVFCLDSKAALENQELNKGKSTIPTNMLYG